MAAAVPAGYIFNPTDQLIIEFLKERYNNVVRVPSEAVLDDPDFYDHGPEQLSERLGDKEAAYFFTKARRNYPKRRNVHGVWKSVAKSKDIKEGNQTIGTKTRLRFEPRVASQKTHWRVDEYKPRVGEDILYELVLCKLYAQKPTRASNKGRKRPMMTSEQYFMSLLKPHFRFQPQDHELIKHFLELKIADHPLPMNIIIDELMLYHYNPAQLSQMYRFDDQKEMYFFTRPNQHETSDHTRTAGDGFWKPISPYLDIKDGNGQLAGQKQLLRFYRGSTTTDSMETNWTMLEYNKAGGTSSEPGRILYDWVLCKVCEEKSNAEQSQELHPRKKRGRLVCPLQESQTTAKKRRLSKNSGPFPHLPQLSFDLIMEILILLPVESLVRFKCVCRFWRLLIQQPDFISKHRRRAKAVELVCQLKWDGNGMAHLYDESFKRTSFCYGLFLEKSFDSQVFRIRNPSTHQVLYLPYAGDAADTSTMGFVVHSSTGACKVACSYCEKEGDLITEVGFKIITIGTDDQWRSLKLPKQNGKCVLKRHCFGPSRVTGAAHVVETIRDGQDLYLQFQSLDVWTERFVMDTLPKGVLSDLEKVWVFPWNHHIAVAGLGEEALNILRLEDFKARKWIEHRIIVPMEILMKLRRLIKWVRRVRVAGVYLQLYPKKVSIFLHPKKEGIFFSYNLQTKEPVEIVDGKTPGQSITEETPCLLTFKSMRPKKVVST